MAAGSVADAAFMAMLSSMQLQQQQQHLLARDDPTGVDPSRDGLSDEGGEGEGVDDESAGDDPAGGGLAGVGDVPAVQQEERGSTGDLCRHPEQPLRGDLMHDRGDENATMVDEQAADANANAMDERDGGRVGGGRAVNEQALPFLADVGGDRAGLVGDGVGRAGGRFVGRTGRGDRAELAGDRAGLVGDGVGRAGGRPVGRAEHGDRAGLAGDGIGRAGGRPVGRAGLAGDGVGRAGGRPRDPNRMGNRALTRGLYEQFNGWFLRDGSAEGVFAAGFAKELTCALPYRGNSTVQMYRGNSTGQICTKESFFESSLARQRFSRFVKKMCLQHKEEIETRFGFDIADIGVHSWRKCGLVKYNCIV
jgi:hypothetical protein